MDKIDIIQADVLKWAAEYDGPKFHAMLTDPPYHLTSITKRFGGDSSAPAQYGKDGAFQRASAGFMGKQWDGGDIAFRPETWAALAEHLHPGAFGMAFSGSRGWHRQAVAIEDAGLIIHPMIGWVYGSGFPKATRIDTQIEKDQPVVGEYQWPDGKPRNVKDHETKRDGIYQDIKTGNEPNNRDITAPATPEAQAWVGHRYGLQALKPALEPIIVFQKPYDGRPIDSITATGAGAINIAGGRISHNEPIKPKKAQETGHDFIRQAGRYKDTTELKLAGRWPSNLILQHSPDCTDADCIPECPVAVMDGATVDATKGFSGYNYDNDNHNKEINQCCEIASIAETNSMLDRQMSNVDLDAFVVEIADIQRSESGGKLTHGGSKTNAQNITGGGFGTGANREAEKFISNLKTGGLGSWRMAQFQTDTTYTILTTTPQITTCQTCNSSLSKNTTIIISVSGKITESNLMELRQEIASDAKNINPSTNTFNVLRERIAVTASLARWNTKENGERKTRTTPATISGSTEGKSGPSRFFKQVGHTLDAADPFVYQAKAGRAEREAGLSGDAHPSHVTGWSGETMPIRQDGSERKMPQRRNTHPTQKPIELTEYLATLLLPPAEYAPRRLLVPFAGAGSEMIGAWRAGWDEITGIELEAEYVEIARARIEHWRKVGYQLKMDI